MHTRWHSSTASQNRWAGAASYDRCWSSSAKGGRVELSDGLGHERYMARPAVRGAEYEDVVDELELDLEPAGPGMHERQRGVCE